MSEGAVLHKQLHVKYWLRCLRSPLPHQYTSNDANRMTLAFFTLSALDLLGVLSTHVTSAERADYVSWIYRCQHEEGGFRAFPGTDLGSSRNEHNKVWDPANLPATYFALASLALLENNFELVRRRKALAWLKKMQREDGSFGETVGADEKIEGGMDARFGYCGAAVRWMLRVGMNGRADGVEDIDVDGLVASIRRAEVGTFCSSAIRSLGRELTCFQTYDGGISDFPFHESHAGYTYCSIAALSLTGRLTSSPGAPGVQANGQLPKSAKRSSGLSSVETTTKWLLFRQTQVIDEQETDDDEPDGDAGLVEESNEQAPISSFERIKSAPLASVIDSTFSSSCFDSNIPSWAGFSGRVGKIADTCYAFWISGSLKILNKMTLIDTERCRRYLLMQTQHPILGGFSKIPGDPPDLYHSYMGLAAISLLDEADGQSSSEPLRQLDPSLCFSLQARQLIESLDWLREIPAPDSTEGRIQPH